MVDEAHSLGVCGATGRGVDELFGLDAREIEVFTGSLSKAVPSTGGYIAGSRALALIVQHASAPFVFSASLSPSSAAAASAALRLIATEAWRRDSLRRNADLLRRAVVRSGLGVVRSDSPIVPVVLGDDERTWDLARRLDDEGVYVTAVVHPAVPRDQARLRLCATAAHTTNDYELLEGLLRRAELR